MPKLKNGGFAHILLIFILLAGIVTGVYLVQHPQIFKPKAHEGNPLTNNLFDITNYSEQEPTGSNKIYLSGTVFEDLNRNGVKDKNEVFVKNIKVSTAVAWISKNGEKSYWPLALPTDNNGFWSFEFEKGWIGESIENLLVSVGEVVWLHNNGKIYLQPFPPIGWNILPIKDNYHPFFQKGTIINDPIPIYGNTNYANIDLPVIGKQSISGKVSGGGITAVLLDASKSDIFTKKLYITRTEEDGYYEFENLPPLTKYRIKVTSLCPWKVITPAYEGHGLGYAGENTNDPLNYTPINSYFDFQVAYDENDPCVTN